MLHLGDITKISGYTAPIVDVVVGGSPCQDLSVAGGRAGLNGERSGLFMEQLRIIKEMRESDRRNGATDDIRPRYMVWENVCGSLSSPGKEKAGEDFRIVLEETAKVCDKDAVIPMPNSGKWTTAGCILGDGWSIAWRVLDAQFWGVPQRRRRIALIADFGGHSAPEILFVSQSLRGHSEQSQPQREGTPSDASRGTGTDDSTPSIAYTLQDREGKAGGGKGALIAEELSATLKSGFAQTLFQPIALDRSAYNQGKNAKYDIGIDENGVAHSLVAKGPGAVAVAALNINDVVRVKYIVRRLTPLECERLQGYPDGWTDIGEWVDSKGKVHKTSDAARYKALGNSIALPPMEMGDEKTLCLL